MENIESFPKAWWSKKNIDQKRWFLYKAVVFIAITLVYITPDRYSDYRFLVGGLFILAALHTVIWPFFIEGTSLLTKIVITAIIIFFIAAVIFPDAMVKMVTDVDSKRKSMNDNYGKTPSPQQSTRQSSRPSRNVYTQTMRVVPGARFKTAPIPAGSASSWDCPDGCVIEIEHDGDRLCYQGNYEGAKCRVMTVGYSSNNVPRQVEQFEMLPGMDIDFPQTMTNPISRFGTSQKIGPVDIFWTVATM